MWWYYVAVVFMHKGILYDCSRYQTIQVILSCKFKFLCIDVHDDIHTYPLHMHPDPESQPHICVTKRLMSQVNPSHRSQLLLGVQEVSWPPGSRAARNSNNAATAQWNSRHSSGYGTRKYHSWYIRGGIVHARHKWCTSKSYAPTCGIDAHKIIKAILSRVSMTPLRQGYPL